MIQTREDAQKFIETITQEFKEKHIKKQIAEELIFIDNVEKEHVKGYHGREILELLQNADDAYQKALDEGKHLAELNVCIKLSGNVLSISNTGTFFDEEGIKAIVQSHNSPKKGKYIGNKGTGFRSILNWAKKVRIFSGVFNLEFSQEIADDIFNSISKEEQIQKQLQKNPQLYVPILSVPKYVKEDGGYDSNATTIEITIDPNKNTDAYNVEAQLKNVDFRVLLFLPNTSKITITVNGAETVYERTKQKIRENTLKNVVDKQSSVTLKKQGKDSSNEVVETYDLFERTVKEVLEEDNIKKDVQLALAVPQDCESFCEENYLYTFFPIHNTQSPFPCIMHATYALSANRDSLSASDNNKAIVLLQLQHLKDVAQSYVDEEKYEKALDLLTPININAYSIYNWKFTQGFLNFKVEDEYLSLFERFAFLPTVNGRCASVQDGVGVIENGYPQCFKGDSFAWLIREIANEKTRCFIKLLARYYGVKLEKTEDDLCNCINAVSGQWRVADRVETFDWWAQRGKREFLPQLLRKQDGGWLSYQERCYFLDGDFEKVTLPNWVKTPALMKEDQEALFKRAEQNQTISAIRVGDNAEGRTQQISRLICQYNIYSSVAGFTYRDRSNIIPAVNTSVEKYEHAVEFIQWLWKNYGKEEGWTPPQGNENSPIKYKFPSGKGAVKNGEELFFGKEYDNPLAEKLFTQAYDKLPSLMDLSLDGEDMKAFESFIAKFGVRHFPKIKKKSITNTTNAYANLVKNALKKQVGATELYSYSLLIIDDLEQILEKLSIQDIANWLSKDVELYAHLRRVRQNGGNIGVSCIYKKPYHKEVSGCVDVEDYILSVFNSVKWVEIGGKKYAPREIVLDKLGSTNKKFEKLIPYFDLRVAVKNTEEEKLTETLNLFDFCPSILQLDSERFYGLLLQIPTIEPFNDSVDMYRAIYRLVEQLDHEISYEDSENKIRFFSEGKVLVKYNKGLEYRTVQEAFLPSSKIICKKDVAIIEKNWRKGNAQIFCKIFNCKEYTEETKIVYDTLKESAANEEFQKYFKEFKEYAKAYKQVNTNIQRDFDKLSVILVSVVEVEVAGQRERIDEEYVLLSKSATQVYITVFKDVFDVRRLSEHIEDIFVNIANVAGFDANRIGELFRTRSKEDREFLIVKEFNSLSVLNDDAFSEALKQNFLDTVAKFDPTYDAKNLGINFADFESDESVEKVIAAFRDLKINKITEFSEKGFEYRLSFDTYYRNQLERIIRNAEIQYKNYVYARALENESLRDSFLTDFRGFVNYQFDSIITGPMDVTAYLVEKFGDWRTQASSNTAGAKYDENYKKMNPDNRFDELIRNDEAAQLMIYFGQEDLFKDWLQEQQVKFEEERDAVKKNPYESLSGVTLQEKEISYSDKDRFSVGAAFSGRSYGTSYTSAMEEKSNRKKKILGNKGELLIYKYLNEKYHGRVTAISEAFEDLGILTPGQGDSTRGYDIEYRDDSDKRFFVEVKTGSSNGFIISPKELEFAKRHTEEYELYLVFDLETGSPSFSKMPKRFWEKEEFRLRDIIEKIEVAF